MSAFAGSLSGLLSGGAVAVAGTLEDILLKMPGRGIEGILPNVIVQEQADDELTITEHPVENGANVTDHAFKQPARLSVTYGWSQSGNGRLFAGAAASPLDIYQELLSLQESRKPFTVITGKRSYSNMLLKRLSQVTDADTENCLLVDMDFQEIILVDTAATSSPTTSLANVASPAANGAMANLGQQQVQDVTASAPASWGTIEWIAP